MAKQVLAPRERVIRAINHQEPDRVPFDLYLSAAAYHELRAYLGLPPDPDQKVGIWSEVSPAVDLLDAMGVDFLYIGLNPASKPSPLARDDGLLYDQWGVGRKKVELPEGGSYYEMERHPLANSELSRASRITPGRTLMIRARVEGLREKFLQARRESDKAIVSRFATSIWEQATYLVGFQEFLELAVLQPEIAEAVLDRTTAVAMGMADVGIGAVGDLIDIYRMSGEDMGTQRSPLISPRMYARLVEPRFRRYWKFIKEKLAEAGSSAKIMVHSCGTVRAFLPSWIEMGLDILDPVQPLALGMEPESLKRDFGSRLTFHGGIDLQELLPKGTPEQVMEGVRQMIRTLGPGGGYIVSPAHNVQQDVPPENLVAIRDAIELFGYYPIQ